VGLGVVLDGGPVDLAGGVVSQRGVVAVVLELRRERRRVHRLLSVSCEVLLGQRIVLDWGGPCSNDILILTLIEVIFIDQIAFIIFLIVHH